MNKNKGLLIAAVLLLLYGTGMFVFANPSEEDYSTNGGNGTNQTVKQTSDPTNNKTTTGDKKQESEVVIPTEENKINPEENTTNLVQNATTINRNPVNNNTNTNNTTNNTNTNDSTKPNTGNNSNNENNGGNSSTNPGNENNPGTSGGSSGSGDNNEGNSGDNNENNEPSVPTPPEEIKPIFVFSEGGSFNTREIFIDEPNFGSMEILLWPSKKVTIPNNTYTLKEDGTYKIVVYDTNGNVIKKVNKMVFDSICPKISAVDGATGTMIIEGATYDIVTLTITDNDIQYIKRVYENGQEEILKEIGKYDSERRSSTMSFSVGGNYTIKAVDRAGNESTIRFVVTGKQALVSGVLPIL